MEMSTEITALAKALAAAQGEFKNVKKESENPYFKSKYADLASVIESARPTLAKHGLSVSQIVGNADDLVSVTTLLLHESGQWIKGEAKCKPVKSDPQALGSCVSYLRRYCLTSIINLASEDDDGNHASKPEQKIESKPEPKKEIKESEEDKKLKANILAEIKRTMDKEKISISDERRKRYLNPDLLTIEDLRKDLVDLVKFVAQRKKQDQEAADKKFDAVPSALDNLALDKEIAANENKS